MSFIPGFGNLDRDYDDEEELTIREIHDSWKVDVNDYSFFEQKWNAYEPYKVSITEKERVGRNTWKDVVTEKQLILWVNIMTRLKMSLLHFALGVKVLSSQQ